MSRELEFEELLYYVVELKDKLNTKLDAQTVKINHQGSIINQQGQIVDELCWQLRELSEKVRDLRAENRRLRERVDQFCPNCAGCHCTVTTYENHIVDKYNELLGVDKKTKPSSISPPALVPSSDESDKRVKTNTEGHDQQQQQENRQTNQKIDEYSQVVKKHDTSGSTKKKWLFGGTSDKKEPVATTSVMSTDSKTIWYIDEESIYEPIELSAKPTTRAQLEKISAEVSSAPRPAPRRLYSAQAVDNLAHYFQDGSSLCEIEEFDEESGDEDRGSDVMLRPTQVKQFGPDSARGSSMVAYSRIAVSSVRTWCISSENIVRFTVSSRPATVVPTTGSDKEASDNRRHAIRSYM
ncbi:uncharacterized protein LOC135699070 [Ochlerotatus camptorhynchus]|uniref:uncharacterized protein LOC135699070 n=1 Tax=Ochlerotatus camptorhynchus TaxID=644619 RepID=UPI0031D48628